MPTNRERMQPLSPAALRATKNFGQYNTDGRWLNATIPAAIAKFRNFAELGFGATCNDCGYTLREGNYHRGLECIRR